MSTIKALIVDDEKRGRDTLQHLLKEHCRGVEVIGQADSVESAFTFVKENQPGLVFLDVEMPRGSGFELLKRFDPVPFRTIFVTAHQHYAIKAIRFSALDYLLKPVDVDELISAVSKATNSMAQPHQYQQLSDSLDGVRLHKIAIPVRDGVSFISIQDIIRMQADRSYTLIFTTTGQMLASRNIKEFEDLLAEHRFFRAHHSHLINLEHVRHFSRIDGYTIQMSDGSEVELARRKKEQFLVVMH